ncbi:MAG: hypothetical protein ACRD1T_05885 [Acidimicrobiia bacterium]
MKRRALLVFLLIAALVLLMALPAFAQRDPFKPLVGTGGSTSGGTTSGGTTSGTTSGTTPSTTTGPSLPQTGIELGITIGVAAWLLLAGLSFEVLDRYRSYSWIR